MNIKSILFPTDFSQYNEAALEYASTLAAEAGATLHIIHLHDVRDISTAMGEASSLYASTWQDELDEARKRLATVLPTIPKVWYEHHCSVGPPQEEIVAFAREHNIDLIVMASHGRTGLSRLLLGSVAESVMRTATCPVLIVKQPVTVSDDTHNPTTSNTRLGILS